LHQPYILEEDCGSSPPLFPGLHMLHVDRAYLGCQSRSRAGTSMVPLVRVVPLRNHTATPPVVVWRHTRSAWPSPLTSPTPMGNQARSTGEPTRALPSNVAPLNSHTAAWPLAV